MLGAQMISVLSATMLLAMFKVAPRELTPRLNLDLNSSAFILPKILVRHQSRSPRWR
jgi:hypothetical protein